MVVNIILYSFFWLLVLIAYLFFRIKNIQKELDRTGNIKKWGFIEYLLEDQIKTDVKYKKNKKKVWQD